MFVQVTLKTQQMCRVYCDLLQLCWNLPRPEQTEAIIAFALKYGWDVEIHEPGDYGMVADFTPRREDQNAVQHDATDDLKAWGPEPEVRQAIA